MLSSLLKGARSLTNINSLGETDKNSNAEKKQQLQFQIEDGAPEQEAKFLDIQTGSPVSPFDFSNSPHISDSHVSDSHNLNATESPTHQSIIDLTKTVAVLQDQQLLFHEDQLKIESQLDSIAKSIEGLTNLFESKFVSSSSSSSSCPQPELQSQKEVKCPNETGSSEDELDDIEASKTKVKSNHNHHCRCGLSSLNKEVKRIALQVNSIAASLDTKGAVERNRMIRTGAPFSFRPEHSDSFYRRPVTWTPVNRQTNTNSRPFSTLESGIVHSSSPGPAGSLASGAASAAVRVVRAWSEASLVDSKLK